MEQDARLAALDDIVEQLRLCANEAQTTYGGAVTTAAVAMFFAGVLNHLATQVSKEAPITFMREVVALFSKMGGRA